jgi:hypothetical protein
MEKIKKGFILPSAAFTIKSGQVKFYKMSDKPPQVGDLVYGKVKRIGQHSTLENASGRIHKIHNNSMAIFVFGNRYAPDYYEGMIPEIIPAETDLLARSGVIGIARVKNTLIKDPTRIKIVGYVCREDGSILNTKAFQLISPKTQIKKTRRAPMILVCGTSMNSGKSMAAVACCWALSTLGHEVRASKVTGTASLKDILHMNDAGARYYTDFTSLGFPSTYLLAENELFHIFNSLDLKYANNPKNFWVVEFADGVIQRETAILLRSNEVKSRIHRLIFCANDAFGAIGGLQVLKDKFDLIPDAISGVCSSSPLHTRELAQFTDIPVFNSAAPDLDQLSQLLLSPFRKKVALNTRGARK